MIQPDYNILNQRGTPMFFSDVFANRPTAGIVGRIFISTDTKEFYRDTGSTWELIGGPGSGTITGSGTIDVVAKFTGASSIGNSNIVLSSGGTFVNTAIGSTTGAGNTYDNLQVLATTESTLNLNTGGGFNTSFFNSIGNLGLLASYSSPSVNNYLFYYAGASLTNRYLAFQTEGVDRLTINQSGQTYIGSQTTSSGLLTINNSSADAHVQVVGANSPSIRIDNAGTGATQRFVMGLSTATNNFIQGSTAGDICISTASASPMLFGMWQTINASEVMRLTTANNVLIGSNIDFGVKLYVNGRISAANSITVGDGGTGLSRLYALSGSDLVFNAGGDRMVIRQTGNVGIGTLSPQGIFEVSGSGVSYFTRSTKSILLNPNVVAANTNALIDTSSGMALAFGTGGTERARIDTSGNLGINTSTPTAKLNVIDSITTFVTNDGNGYARLSVSGGSVQLGLQRTGTSAGIFYIGGDQNFFSIWNDLFTRLVNVSQTGNLLVGTSVDTGERLVVSGNARIQTTSGSGLSIVTNDVSVLTMSSSGGTTKNWGFATTNLAASDFGIYQSNSAGGNPISAGTPKLYFDGNANVGIGTSNPSALLHLSSSTATNFYLQSAAGNSAIMRYFIGSQEAVTTRSLSTGDYIIETGLGSPGERIRITGSNGNLLVGTSVDAGYKLDVSGTGYFSSTVTLGGGSRIAAVAGNGLNLNAGSADRLIIASTGNVIIGSTTDQGQKLYLNGSLRIDGQTSGTSGGNSGQHLIINCDGTTYKIALLNP